MNLLLGLLGEIMRMSGKMAKLTKTALLASGVFTAMIAPAHAYLDPGTGSLLLQGLVGAVTGSLYVFRNFWGRMLAFLPFRRKKSDGAHSSGAETAGESRD